MRDDDDALMKAIALSLHDSPGFVDDDGDALMKAIALSLQDSPGFLDVVKTPPSNVENTERTPIARKDDSGNRKRNFLRKSFPDHLILGEEGGVIGDSLEK